MKSIGMIVTRLRGSRPAFGKPGIEPRWTHANKDGVGRAYSGGSRVWFTLFNGVITEAYYPTVDRPQLRDLQYLVSDGQGLFHEEKRHLNSQVERLSRHSLGYRIINSDPEGRYQITKQVIADPHLPCMLQQMRISGSQTALCGLHFYALCAPHLDGGGWGNNAYVVEVDGKRLLIANKGGAWLALGATVPFARVSCGYVGKSDGWTDLADNFQMDWEFDQALNGNVALTGELDLANRFEFALGLAFGDGLHSAVTTLFQSLAIPFQEQLDRFEEQWKRPSRNMHKLEKASGDGGNLYHASYSLLLAHEDKTYPGACIASLSIPWGEAKGAEDMGGYHLVWTRDMVNSATGLLAAGNLRTPLRALIYLAASQQPDGGFPQNFWINGEPYWRGIQLDEVAFPILLARRLYREDALQDFDPYPMVLRAAAYLIRNGPATQQERWEEVSGYSPSTLASNIAALIYAACFCRERGDDPTAQFLEEYACFLGCHLEPWTVTTEGTLVPGINRHFIRIMPADVRDSFTHEDSNRGTVTIANRPPGTQREFLAKEIVDAGFLELVRYGIRKPDDPVIVDSLRVIDAVLKVDTPFGPCWHRYNHDGYGQREDGGPFEWAGRGRVWPLLTGERGHYELAAGRDARTFTRALEQFASRTGLLTEQLWDEANRPEQHLCLGRPTGAAMPLMWAHAEYVKLLRSITDTQVFDCVPEAADRYCTKAGCHPLEIWKPTRRVSKVRRGMTLRVQAPAPFRLHWSANDWQDVQDTISAPTRLGIEYVDIPIGSAQTAPIRFTLFWTAEGRWEGRDCEVAVVA
jgi:glucoamylase